MFVLFVNVDGIEVRAHAQPLLPFGGVNIRIWRLQPQQQLIVAWNCAWQAKLEVALVMHLKSISTISLESPSVNICDQAYRWQRALHIHCVVNEKKRESKSSCALPLAIRFSVSVCKFSCGLFTFVFDNMFVSMHPTTRTHSTTFRTLDAILKIRLVARSFASL